MCFRVHDRLAAADNFAAVSRSWHRRRCLPRDRIERFRQTSDTLPTPRNIVRPRVLRLVIPFKFPLLSEFRAKFVTRNTRKKCLLDSILRRGKVNNRTKSSEKKKKKKKEKLSKLD